MDEPLLGREADDDAKDGRAGGERGQRKRHHARRLVRVIVEMVIARLSVESHPESSRHVERGKDRGNDPDRVEHEVAVDKGGAEYFVLRPEAREWRQRGERATRDQHRSESHRHLATQAAHFPYVLLAAEAVDPRARTEEEDRREEGVRREAAAGSAGWGGPE